MDIAGRKITVIGAARSGLAAARLALARGALVKISDQRPQGEVTASLGNLAGQVELECGGHTEGFVIDADFVVASPGVWRDAAPLCWARARGIAVMGEIEFAWRFCRRPVVAVTGSNGKTTTVTLIRDVLSGFGRKVCLCGNIGTPFADHVLDESIDIFVVEISSFQLELADTFAPHVAVITNFSQNHLDRHPDMQDYFSAKARIFARQAATDFALLNAQDEWSMKLSGSLPARTLLFNKTGETLDSNRSAVQAVAGVFGVPQEIVREVFNRFGGVEHRLERVRVLNGVTYINDSKSTTVEAGRWALMNVPSPVILICGGHDKGMDYRPLRDLVKSKVRRLVVLTREEASRRILHEAFEGLVPVEDHDSMAEALSGIRAMAISGDHVLLSPMFASFDMFDNFEHRGRVFKEIVLKLPEFSTAGIVPGGD